MYKLNSEHIGKIVIEEEKRGMEVIILSKFDNTTLYPVKEHISIVKDIQRECTDSKMSKLTLQFKNREEETFAYIDNSIVIGSVVSTIGFLIENYNSSSYYCKGGINLVLSTIPDLQRNYHQLSVNKVYRMGVVLELSEVNLETKKYSFGDNVKPIEGVKGFYYTTRDKEKALLDKIRNNTDTNSLFDNLDHSNEDYPDDDTNNDNIV